MYKKYGNKFMCFSPPVMLATFLIEFGLLFYTLWRYKLTKLSRLIVVFIACLGVFQLAEYMTCGGLGLGRTEWVQLGYVGITMLPVLGLHIAATIANESIKPLLIAAYVSAAIYVSYFVLLAGTVVARECAPNYAIFDIHGPGAILYVVYYYGWLLLTIGLAMHWAKSQPKQASALQWFAGGHAAFIVPTTFANIIDPATLAAIPSIMCGFAVLSALILVWRVLPLAKVPLSQQKPLKKHNQK